MSGLTAKAVRSKLPLIPWLRERFGIEIPGDLDTSQYTLPSLAGAKVKQLGRNNVVVYCAGAKFLPSPKIVLERRASDNVIVIGGGSHPAKSIHFQGSGNVCILGENISWPLDIDVRFSSDCGCLVVGAKATSNGTSIILEGHSKSVLIGDDCMFAAGTAIRTSDLHAIYDDDGQALNPSADVRLERHVWLGMDAFVGKGVRIGEGSIVAAKALVSREIDRATLVGGVPAKVLRQDIKWSRERPPSS